MNAIPVVTVVLLALVLIAQLVILRRVRSVSERLHPMPDLDFTKLQAAVAADTSAESSAATLLNGVGSQLAAVSAQLAAANAANDPTKQAAAQAAIDALAVQVNSNVSGWAAAVAANTPAVPATSSTPSSATPTSGS